MSRRWVPPVRRPAASVRRVVLAWTRATAVVAGQLGVLVASLWLFAHTQRSELPLFVAWLPLLAFAGLLLVAARTKYRRAGRENPAWVGYLLVAAAPFTAFGGGCAVDGALPLGARLLRSGVRIGVELGDGACHTYLNGALLVLGYAMLGVGLHLDDRGLGWFAERLVD
ncbi:MAG: hypothetical protein V5A38_07460 [Halolamina sp.]|uniref:hypothetical protein n=1 Tax=Halolamina sp. TaxID=1940283 RepID=UPI002FC3AB8C